MRRRAAIVALVAACVALAADQAPRAARVVLVTIDGLRGDYLAASDPYHLKIPTLRRLIAEGSASDRTISVFPTLTGTAHTTLVTGVSAGRYGILGNNRFDPSAWAWATGGYDAQPRYTGHADIKAGTLWAAAAARRLVTAAVYVVIATDREKPPSW